MMHAAVRLSSAPLLRAILFSEFPEAFVRKKIVHKLRQHGVDIVRVEGMARAGELSLAGGGLDVAMLMYEIGSHSRETNKAKEAAKAAGLRLVYLSRKAAFWPVDFRTEEQMQSMETRIATPRAVPLDKVELLLKDYRELFEDNVSHDEMVPYLKQYWTGGELRSGGQLAAWIHTQVREKAVSKDFDDWWTGARIVHIKTRSAVPPKPAPIPSHPVALVPRPAATPSVSVAAPPPSAQPIRPASAPPPPLAPTTPTTPTTQTTSEPPPAEDIYAQYGMVPSTSGPPSKVPFAARVPLARTYIDLYTRGAPERDILDAVRTYWVDGGAALTWLQLSSFLRTSVALRKMPNFFCDWYVDQRMKLPLPSGKQAPPCPKIIAAVTGKLEAPEKITPPSAAPPPPAPVSVVRLVASSPDALPSTRDVALACDTLVHAGLFTPDEAFASLVRFTTEDHL